MNTSFRRALLAGTAVLGSYVGVWAEFLPSSFAAAFPGLGWGVFGVLHFGYHVTHPTGSAVDVVASLATLAIAALLGIALALPNRDRSGTEEARA